MTERDIAQAGPRRPRHRYWLPASVALALALDVAAAGFGRFAWCGFGCQDAPGVLPVALGSVGVVAVVTLLAVALPPWTPGWRRPVIAAAAGLAAAGLAAVWVFPLG
ncbi:hypothetical protein [Leifsonia shinshuensis]|uniref:Uncharacterized protein n=1 Tax=Leifsonia shinshuensis TaxID=150026 RepID=A0A7G6YD40_9MICO|nr:hypothetical protein [Leifsonia shinshuensis]QNE36405.1 hypothetical protein F1C12_15650 [Leifsonia shinshuensis]